MAVFYSCLFSNTTCFFRLLSSTFCLINATSQQVKNTTKLTQTIQAPVAKLLNAKDK